MSLLAADITHVLAFYANGRALAISLRAATNSVRSECMSRPVFQVSSIAI